MPNNSTLPTADECNELAPHYRAILEKLNEWKDRDTDPSNDWLYHYALSDITAAWKQVYRMGVRNQILNDRHGTTN